MGWNLKLRRRTGWTELPLSNGWAGKLFVKRVGDTVWGRAEGLDGSAATSTLVAIMPSGYRTEGAVLERGLFHHTTGSPVSRWWCALNGFSSPNGLTSPLYGSFSWDTTDPMPAGGA